MITEPFWKISKKLLKRKERWDSKLNPRNVRFFPWWHHWKTTIDNFSIFPKTLPRDQNTKERWTYHSWFTAWPEITSRPIGKENELEKVNGIVEKLDAHYGFFMLKNCFSLPKLLYFLRSSTCLNHPALLEKYDKTVRDGLFKVCNVNFDDISSTQLALPAEMGGLGVSSASLLALPAFLASAFGASDFLTMIFSETFEDVSFTKAFEKWLSLTNEQESSLDGTQKNWTTCLRQNRPRFDF